jgi:hypothetical protein
MKPLHTLADDEFGAALQRALHELPDAPAALQRAAVDLWVAPPPRLADVAQAALRLVSAVLRFDSWGAGQTAVAQGLRSLRAPTASATRHLLFSAEGRDVDLRIAPATEGHVLTGQILGPDEGGTVELTPQGAASGTADAAHAVAIDAMGEFRIAGLAAGTYLLTLKLGADQIVLPALQVGEPAGDTAG